MLHMRDAKFIIFVIGLLHLFWILLVINLEARLTILYFFILCLDLSINLYIIISPRLCINFDVLSYPILKTQPEQSWFPFMKH
jgi:hypothetical protein